MNQRSGGNDGMDAHRLFFFERLTAMHDLWHVLTGYGIDVAGEATLLSFSFPQIGNRPLAFLTVLAFVTGPKREGLHFQRVLWQAFRRGRAATFLPAAHYEALLPLPLDRVRRQLGIRDARKAHPRGVVRCDDRQEFFERVPAH